jgi:hypothetical protein
MTDAVLWQILVAWAISGAVGLAIGKHKGRPTAGFVFGLLAGPLGWLVVAVGPNNQPKCPQCRGVVVPGASKCKNCGSDIPLMV